MVRTVTRPVVSVRQGRYGVRQAGGWTLANTVRSLLLTLNLCRFHHIQLVIIMYDLNHEES